MSYRLYVKFAGNKTFQPLDISSGKPVKNLIRATIVAESKYSELLKYVDACKADHPEHTFEIRKIQDKPPKVKESKPDQSDKSLKEMFYDLLDDKTPSEIMSAFIDAMKQAYYPSSGCHNDLIDTIIPYAKEHNYGVIENYSGGAKTNIVCCDNLDQQSKLDEFLTTILFPVYLDQETHLFTA